MLSMKEINLYTDGACSVNVQIGGWGCALIFGKHRKELSGGELNTTNNRMELMAVIKGLEALKEPCIVNIFSDSAYVVNAFQKNWIYSWQMAGWKTSSKEKVKNIDLWEKLVDLGCYHKLNFFKVKGHSDNELNNLCDKLATDEIKKIKSTLPN